MEFKDETFKIYELFWNEWSVNNYSNWDDLIKSKDLGIIFIEVGQGLISHNYKIVDEKKWVLNKIKYGF